MSLKQRAKQGVLPLLVTDGHERLVEVTICDSISGGAGELNHMPTGLSLLRMLEDGTEYRQRYVQEP